MIMKLFSRKNTEVERKVPQRRNPLNIFPDRDWKIIFTIFVCLNLAALGFHAYLFFKINRGGFFTESEHTPIEANTVDESRLEKVLEVFSSKETELLKKIAEPENAPSVRNEL